MMTFQNTSRSLPLVTSAVLLTLGLSGLWRDAQSTQEMNRAVAETLPVPAEWELTGIPNGNPAADSVMADMQENGSESVTGCVSLPFDERAQERSRFLLDLENRSATLTRNLRSEWQASQQNFEARMQDLMAIRKALPVADRSDSTEVENPVTVSSRSKSKMERMIYPIVQMKGNGTVGSGVAVANEPAPGGAWSVWVVTAYHVVEEVRDFSNYDQTVVEVHFFDADLGRVSEDSCLGYEVVAYPEADLSLLRIERSEPWPWLAEVAPEPVCENLSVFDSVYAVGCPLGNQPIPTRGEISSQYKKVGDEIYWMVSAPTFFGNSGGGIFLSENGQLVGISSMIYTYGKRSPMVVPHMGLFVPLAQVRSWLRREGFVHLLGTSSGLPMTASGSDLSASEGDSGSF
jgi:S1-C subfamily serine protease